MFGFRTFKNIQEKKDYYKKFLKEVVHLREHSFQHFVQYEKDEVLLNLNLSSLVKEVRKKLTNTKSSLYLAKFEW